MRRELLFLAAVQIFLLLSMNVADSYIINQSDPNGSNTINNGLDSQELFSFIGKILVNLMTIKQIGTVSALEVNNASFNCCLATNNGAACQDIVPGFVSSTDSNSCSNPLPASCSQVSSCQLGTCIYNQGQTCAANAPTQACQSAGGNWTSIGIFNVPECQKGLCVLGGGAQLSTRKQCEIFSNSSGVNIDFRLGLNEADLQTLNLGASRGACITNGNCRFVSASECNGLFYKDILCSNPDLNTICKPSNQTKCSNGNVHFIDSCGNLANIYDASKTNSEDYWKIVSKSNCTINQKNPASIKNCGLCNSAPSMKCSPANKSQVSHGNYFCKNLKCIDEKGNQRENGESWCAFDSHNGDGKDPAGAEYWKVSCENGEIKTDICGNARSGICREKTIQQDDKKFSVASCVVNEALKCIDYNSDKDMEKKCKGNSQCLIKNVNIDSNFKFDVCVPQYPRGFGLKSNSTDSSDVLCSVANNKCTVVYVKTFGGWKCKENCNCETKKFTEQMNDLCISLGDCGSYINYIGDGTDNINVKGAPGISWKNYIQYAKPQEKKIETANLSQLSASEAHVNDFNSQNGGLDLKNVQMGAGVFGVGKAAAFYFIPSLKTATLTYSVATPEGVMLTEGAGWTTITSQTFLAQFSWALSGLSVGLIAGQLLAKFLGIQGSAAAVLTVASGVAGAAIGLKFFTTQFANSAWLTYTIWIAIAIIAFIAITGIGKTRTKTVQFTCLPWQAPTGGDNCNKCNDPAKPCTKYRCESLGQACTLLNGNTDKPICQSLHKESIPPKITPGEVKLDNFSFTNENQNSVEIRGCVREFTPLLFTLNTDEYAQCKWSFQPNANYDSMEDYAIEGTHYSLNHTFAAEGLSLSLLEANEISGNIIKGFTGNMSLSIRCKDYFGNFNLNEYTVKFCVNSGPDKTPVMPSYISTNPINGSTLKYGTKNVNFTMWTNEPAECKYDLTKGKDYDSMASSMSCLTNLTDRDTYGWPCSASFNNLTLRNNLYIRCKDQPWKNDSERNANAQDYAYTLYVTENNLEINSSYVVYNGARTNLNANSSPEILGGGTSFPIELNLQTAKGVNNGVSTCFYQWGNNSIPFLNTNSRTHNQKLNLLNGNYTIPVMCGDSAGNVASTNAAFRLNIDTSAPIVVRAYNEAGKLKLLTNEQAKCYSSLDQSNQCGFNIENATGMEIGFAKDHTTNWNVNKVHYIKCKDLFNNTNSGCAIQISPSYFG